MGSLTHLLTHRLGVHRTALLALLAVVTGSATPRPGGLAGAVHRRLRPGAGRHGGRQRVTAPAGQAALPGPDHRRDRGLLLRADGRRSDAGRAHRAGRRREPAPGAGGSACGRSRPAWRRCRGSGCCATTSRERDPAVTLSPRLLLRSRLAWSMAVFFGAQSAQAYAQFGWLPSIYADAGLSAQTAALMLTVLTMVGVPAPFLLPAYAQATSDHRPLVVVFAAVTPSGWAGLIAGADDRCRGCGRRCSVSAACAFPWVLAMMALRTRTADGTAALSGFVQSAGYLLAAVGPLGTGLLHDASGGWTVPLVVLIALTLPMLWTGLRFARPADARGRAGRSRRGRRLAQTALRRTSQGSTLTCRQPPATARSSIRGQLLHVGVVVRARAAAPSCPARRLRAGRPPPADRTPASGRGMPRARRNSGCANDRAAVVHRRARAVLECVPAVGAVRSARVRRRCTGRAPDASRGRSWRPRPRVGEPFPAGVVERRPRTCPSRAANAMVRSVASVGSVPGVPGEPDAGGGSHSRTSPQTDAWVPLRSTSRSPSKATDAAAPKTLWVRSGHQAPMWAVNSSNAVSRSARDQHLAVHGGDRGHGACLLADVASGVDLLVHVAGERIEHAVPLPDQPLLQRHQALGRQRVEVAGAPAAVLDQSGRLQHLEVLADRWAGRSASRRRSRRPVAGRPRAARPCAGDSGRRARRGCGRRRTPLLGHSWVTVTVEQPLPVGNRYTTDSGSSCLPVGPIWISVPISGHTPQS